MTKCVLCEDRVRWESEVALWKFSSSCLSFLFFKFQGTRRRGLLAESEDAGEVLRDWRESGVEK